MDENKQTDSTIRRTKTNKQTVRLKGRTQTNRQYDQKDEKYNYDQTMKNAQMFECVQICIVDIRICAMYKFLSIIQVAELSKKNKSKNN